MKTNWKTNKMTDQYCVSNSEVFENCECVMVLWKQWQTLGSSHTEECFVLFTQGSNGACHVCQFMNKWPILYECLIR